MNRNPLPFLILAVLLHAPQSRAIEITASGASITVSSGKADVGGKSVTVTQAVTLPIAAAPVLKAENEALTLSVDKPVGYAKGTKLRACNARDVNAAGSFVPGSLVIKRTQNGEPLKLGEDYLVDEVWGLVGLGPKSQVTAKDTVLTSYQYSMLRMDTVQVSAEGKASVKQGEPHISAPVPPDADAGQVAIAHVFVNYRDTEVKADQIYLITETSRLARRADCPKSWPSSRLDSP